MAMTPDDLTPDDLIPAGPIPAGQHPSPAAEAAVDQAAHLLRRHVDSRWVEIADHLLSQALTATRRSYPVRALAAGGRVHVSEQVLVAYLRAAIADVAGAAPTNIVVRTDAGYRYTGVAIELIAHYGQPLLPIADRVRELAAATLTELLGPVTPQVTVTTMHVHIGDVTETDPRGAR